MKISVVVPTLNSIDDVKECVAGLKKQSLACTIIVVCNGTSDGTQRHLATDHPDVIVLSYLKPLGFAGAVNKGIQYSLENNYDYIALLNNDAMPSPKWLEELSETISSDSSIGIATSKILDYEGNRFDTSGDCYTEWFLAYPRGRGLKDRGQYDIQEDVTSASGGASIYRASMLRQIGLFDENFYAYYEDVDISLRARHAGWRITYQPKAVVRHKIGGTSKTIKGFTTLHTMKNLPLLIIKNVPFMTVVKNLWRFEIAYLMFMGRSFTRLQGHYAVQGWLESLVFTPKKLVERFRILSGSKLSRKEFENLLVKDLPPNAKLLRAMRSKIKRS